MATKTFKLRMDFALLDRLSTSAQNIYHRADEVHQWLWDTHVVFNAGVDYLATWLLRMHRGAGVWREKKDGIWGEWQAITTHAALGDARSKLNDNPFTFAVVENHELLNAFTEHGKSEIEAVDLAECCRRIAGRLCPPSKERDNKQMPRDSLDLLISPFSEARGLRTGPTTLRWELIRIAIQHNVAGRFLVEAEELVRKRADGDEKDLKRFRNLVAKSLTDAGLPDLSLSQWCLFHKKTSSKVEEPDAAQTAPVLTETEWTEIRRRYIELAKRPGWLQDIVSADEAAKAASWPLLLESLAKREEMHDENGQKRITSLMERSKRPNADWANDRKTTIDELIAETDDYRRLISAGVLPLPNFACYHDDASVTLGPVRLRNVGSEWKRSMWDMAGQRVRSHLGWVRRRAGERLLWEKNKLLFARGGWKRTKRNGKKIKGDEILPEDIVFDLPLENPEDFESCHAFGTCKWFAVLRQYEEKVMPSHLERVAFGAGGVQRLTGRTVKGWAKVRDRWKGFLAKTPSATMDQLVGIVNQMRARKSREVGDQHIFKWLAEPERRWLWDSTDSGDDNYCGRDDRDCVSAMAAYNRAFSERPESITFTQSHPTLHPVWPFFGENSAVKYTLINDFLDGRSEPCLILCMAQLLARQPDGSYQAKDNVRIPMRGYRDFEKSFDLPAGQEVTAKKKLAFHDDLLAGATREGTLSGVKIVWHRPAMEHAQQRHNQSQAKGQPRAKHDPPQNPPTNRVYAAFSCDAGEASLPGWLTKGVGKSFVPKRPMDGMAKAFFLDAAITKTAKGTSGVPLAPGERRWPKEVVEKGLCVRGTDLGYRSSSVGAWWRLAFEAPRGTTQWQVGICAENRRPVIAVLEHQAVVSLPGDGEEIPETERQLHERLYSLRVRLNLNNMLLGVARLLTLESLERRVPKEERKRTRGGIARPNGLVWKTTTDLLSSDEIKQNCGKAAERLLAWHERDAFTDAMKAIGFDGSIWQWLEKQNPVFAEIAANVPKTVVPSEKDATAQKINREPLRQLREKEDAAFADVIFKHRVAFSHAICNGHDGAKRRRALSGLWAELDRSLLQEVSYGDKLTSEGKNKPSETGLFRLLRKPPVTKHQDRKDDSNNLPHGRTHRGGLSMGRLNFLDLVKSFVRKWSCRPRWPGDVRRLSENEKFDRQDTEHLDHLREHRAKLVAHADVAQSLGFAQDLRRGVWRFRDPKTGELLWHSPERGHFYRQDGDRLVQVPTPQGVIEPDTKHPHAHGPVAHILVYENLSRYLMRADRPKNENAGLARWSHRSILKYAQHIGGLFSLPVATVSAAYSSRFCCRCGAPGCRAVQFDPSWLDQEWIRRILSSTDPRDMAMKGIARKVQERLAVNALAFAGIDDWLWVLRDGGTHFVCANRNCSVNSRPANADENAAANIGLWFLRGIEDFRVKIDGSGKPANPLRFVNIDRFAQEQTSDATYWRVATEADTSKKKRKKASNDDDDDAEDDSDEDSGGAWLFRDPSDSAFPKERWYEPTWFWNEVGRYAAGGIKAANALREHDD